MDKQMIDLIYIDFSLHSFMEWQTSFGTLNFLCILDSNSSEPVLQKEDFCHCGLFLGLIETHALLAQMGNFSWKRLFLWISKDLGYIHSVCFLKHNLSYFLAKFLMSEATTNSTHVSADKSRGNYTLSSLPPPWQVSGFLWISWEYLLRLGTPGWKTVMTLRVPLSSFHCSN
jgi:hypothetical protein